MKSIAIFFLFIGIILIINGYYSQMYEISEKPKTTIKFIPRNIYEDQMNPQEQLSEFYKSLFDSVQPTLYNDKPDITTK
jgi:hypothetical protein